MKRTLLDLTQNILSALSSDTVNSIGDSPESLQVADIIKTVYYNIVSKGDLPEHNQLFQLEASTDPDKPVLMLRPEHVSSIQWIKYFDTDVTGQNNTSDTVLHDINLDVTASTDNSAGATPSYKYVTILPVQQFLDMTNSFNTNNDNVATFTFTDISVPVNTFTFNYKSDRRPCYCTIIQNLYILFDSFDSFVDDTLQASKTLCFGQVVPPFTMDDTFIPDLDDQQFPLLLNEAKALAFFELKQTIHPKAEEESKMQWSTVQKNKSLANKPSYFDQLPHYGRK